MPSAAPGVRRQKLLGYHTRLHGSLFCTFRRILSRGSQNRLSTIGSSDELQYRLSYREHPHGVMSTEHIGLQPPDRLGRPCVPQPPPDPRGTKAKKKKKKERKKNNLIIIINGKITRTVMRLTKSQIFEIESWPFLCT